MGEYPAELVEQNHSNCIEEDLQINTVVKESSAQCPNGEAAELNFENDEPVDGINDMSENNTDPSELTHNIDTNLEKWRDSYQIGCDESINLSGVSEAKSLESYPCNGETESVEIKEQFGRKVEIEELNYIAEENYVEETEDV